MGRWGDGETQEQGAGRIRRSEFGGRRSEVGGRRERKRGQVQFAGTAGRVLRDKLDLSPFPLSSLSALNFSFSEGPFPGIVSFLEGVSVMRDLAETIRTLLIAAG